MAFEMDARICFHCKRDHPLSACSKRRCAVSKSLLLLRDHWRNINESSLPAASSWSLGIDALGKKCAICHGHLVIPRDQSWTKLEAEKVDDWCWEWDIIGGISRKGGICRQGGRMFRIGDIIKEKRVCYCFCAWLRNINLGYTVHRIELAILRQSAIYYSIGRFRLSRYALLKTL